MGKENSFRLPKDLVLFDLEATCSYQGDKNFNSMAMETIEIGAVKLLNGEVADEFDVYIKPIVQPCLTKYCIDLTAITQEKVGNGVTFERALTDFMKFSNRLPIYSYGRYDKIQLKRDLERQAQALQQDDEVLKLLDNHHNLKSLVKQKVNNFNVPVENTYARAIVEHINGTGSYQGRQHNGLVDSQNMVTIYQWLYNT